MCRVLLCCFLAIHPNSNRGTETQQSTNDFDANGNLLHLDNIANLDWYYNNTLNKLTKADKSNTTQYYVYDYQGKRVRTVTESNHQVQSQRDRLPALDISTNQTKQQSTTLHIGTHILSKSSDPLNQGLSILPTKGLGIWHRNNINRCCRLFLFPCSGSVFVALGFCLCMLKKHLNKRLWKEV
jgi:Na+-transporting NADH:ubiquinone oxidoreductase subunit NqrC